MSRKIWCGISPLQYHISECLYYSSLAIWYTHYIYIVQQDESNLEGYSIDDMFVFIHDDCHKE